MSIVFLDIRNRFTRMCQQSLDHIARIKRLTRQQIVEGASQAVDIRPVIHAMRITRLFGGHVIDRTHNHTGLREILFLLFLSTETRRPHVQDLDTAVSIQH